MTTRLKTVEYAFDFDSSVVAGTVFRTLGPITLTLSENSARVFKSVYAIVTPSSNRTTNATNSTAPVVGVQLAAVAFADTTVGIDGNGWNYDSMAQHHFTVDLTSYFVTNFGSAATQTCSVRVKMPESTVNCSITLVITYYYEDTDATHTTTKKIPLAGHTSVLTTGLVEIETNEVPLLDTFCPESTKTFNNIWFETVMMCKDPNATFTTGFALDAAASADDGTHQTGGTTTGDMYGYRRVWTQNSMTTSSAHAFKAKASVASCVYEVCVLLCVTYTFDPAATTRVLVSLEIPAAVEGAVMPSVNIATSTRAQRDRFVFSIQSANPTLVQSAVRWGSVQIDSGAYSSVLYRVGSQTQQAYTNPRSVAFTQYKNLSRIQQRVDSGSAQGAGITLVRGQNIVFSDRYVNNSDTADQDYSIHAPILYLNVVVDKPAGGVGIVEKTIKQLLFASQYPSYFNGTYTANQMYLPNYAPVIPEAKWALVTGFGFRSYISSQVPVLYVSVRNGEMGSTSDSGWFAVDTPSEPNEGLDEEYNTCSMRKWFRFAGDFDTERMNPFSPRTYGLTVINSNVGQSTGYVWLFTYHSMTCVATGSVRGYTGDGSGISVQIHDASSYALLYTGSTIIGGTYAITGYDSSALVFAEAKQDSTHLGRSDSFYMI